MSRPATPWAEGYKAGLARAARIVGRVRCPHPDDACTWRHGPYNEAVDQIAGGIERALRRPPRRGRR